MKKFLQTLSFVRVLTLDLDSKPIVSLLLRVRNRHTCSELNKTI